MNKIFSFNRSYFNYTGYLYPCIASTLLVASIYAAFKFKIGSYFFKKEDNSPSNLKDRVEISVTFNEQSITKSQLINKKELMAPYHVDFSSPDLTPSVDLSTPKNITPAPNRCLPSHQKGSESRSQPVDIEEKSMVRPVSQRFEEKDFRSAQSYLKYIHSKILARFSKILAEPVCQLMPLEHRIKMTPRISLNNKIEIYPPQIGRCLAKMNVKSEEISKILHVINQGFCADFDDLEPFMNVELDQESMNLNSKRSGLDIKVENQSAQLIFTLFYKVARAHSSTRMRTTVKVETVIKVSACYQVTCECNLVRSRGLTV